MKRGQAYRVTKAFLDADGDEHSTGEEWAFLAQWFNRMDEELSLCVRLKSNEEWRIPLIWTPDEQQEIIENFSEFVEEVSW